MATVVSTYNVFAWKRDLYCGKCQTRYVVKFEDIQRDRFKKPGTYWFDGSAHASAREHLFVECPTCRDIVFVDDVPYAVKIRVPS